jgi:protein transport protein SEC23
VFACSLDQVGLAEMKTAVDQTGGVMVLAEQFRAETFRSSLRRLFRRDASGALDMYFNATFRYELGLSQIPALFDAPGRMQYY